MGTPKIGSVRYSVGRKINVCMSAHGGRREERGNGKRKERFLRAVAFKDVGVLLSILKM
jgi:hypothetical protein